MSGKITHRPTWAEINLNNLISNYHSIKEFVGSDLEFMAIVKSDAYGHGAVSCAKKLEAEGVDWLGVALPEEGLELREKGIKTPILCLGSFWEGQQNALLENNLTPVIYQIETARLFNRAAADRNVIADVHIKIDTGMGRIGVRYEQATEFANAFVEFKNLRVDGLMTHFAAADDLDQSDFTNVQIDRFYKVVELFKAKGFRPSFINLANSPAAVGFEKSRGNLIRIGGILYGLGDDVLPEEIAKPELKPVMSLHSKITYLKQIPKGETLGYGRTFTTDRNSTIAVIPIGYQDGFRRALSNVSHSIINNRYVPIVGRISMDWTILDVTDLPDVKVNDEVLLIGACGDLKITAEDLARKIGTISYEITCGINRRVTRKYVGS